jgi:hypothetical protein
MRAHLGDYGAGSLGLEEKIQAPFRLHDACDVGEVVGGWRMAAAGAVKGALAAECGKYTRRTS